MKLLTRCLIAVGLLTFIVVIALSTTQSGLVWIYEKTQNRLPPELTIEKIEGRLIGPIALHGLTYRFDKGVVTAEQITLDWSPGSLLSTHVDIHRVQVNALNIQLPPSDTDPAAKTLALPDIQLPWLLTLDELLVEGIVLNQGDANLNLRQAKLKANALLGNVNIEELSLENDDFNVTIAGSLQPTRNYRHTLKIQWRARLPSQAMVQGSGQLAGNVKATQLRQTVNGALTLSLKAKLENLLDKLSWQGAVDINAFDSQSLDANWPPLTGSLKIESQGDLEMAIFSGTMNGDNPAHGSFAATFALQRLGNNTLEIENLSIHAPRDKAPKDPRLASRLNIQGQWLLGANGGDIKLNLNWQHLRWPMQETPWFDSAKGAASIEGNLEHYKIQLSSDKPWPQIPDSTWSVRAQGSPSGLEIQSLHISALGGEIKAVGQLNWSPALTWDAEINTTNLNPASLSPQWPGQLSGTVISSGRIDEERLIADVDIKNLHGQLRDYPVSLSSRFTWGSTPGEDSGLDMAHLDIAQLEFSSGKARVSAQGTLGESSALQWRINAMDIGALYPQAKGQLQAQGSLSGSRETPVIEATLKGRHLALPDYQIGAIEGQVAVDVLHWQDTKIELTSQALLLKGQALQKLTIKGGTERLKVDAVADQASMQLEFAGTPTQKGWQGQLKRADIQSKLFNDWQLVGPSFLNIEHDALSTDTLCWQNNEGAKLCTSLIRRASSWHSKLTIDRLSLLLFSKWLPEDLKVDGKLAASATLNLQGETLLGQASLELPKGVVHYPILEGERDQWAYRGGNVTFLLNENGLQSNAKLAMSNGDQLQFEAELPGAQLLGLDSTTQALRASAQLSAHDLGLVEALIPEIQDLHGQVAVDLNVTGTLAKPALKGSAKLIDGSLRIPRLGITVDQLSLLSQNSAVENINFQLKARSGEGNLVVEGKTALNKNRGWPTEFFIKGEDFTIAQIPEAQIRVSPDLLVRVQKHKVRVSGDVHIPYARLQPKDITSAAQVSGDTIILGDEAQPTEKWAITSDVRLTLGDHVDFYGYGFEGRFGGSVLLQEEPGQATRAKGEITIPEGRYRAYGQRLDIEQGRFIFSGGPPSNPGIDVRAVRHINQVTVGVKLRGNLNKPQIELFSNPAMGETDTLSYLLLGRPIEGASSEDGNMMAQAALALGLSGGDRIARGLGNRFGMDEMRIDSNDTGDQASLVMGRHLTPRLYIGYGVGLIQAINTFNVHYQLSKHWQLKGESGENSGIDILYTIDR